jgi:ubiquinone/menaquinone biosynthesis C-methylase UbiE
LKSAQGFSQEAVIAEAPASEIGGTNAGIHSFDRAAASFDQHRALPPHVPEAIRCALLSTVSTPNPRILDLGAGSGRIGRPFVAAGDDYVGADLSFGMLRAFAARDDLGGHGAPRLIQVDGQQLPFADGIFDILMLMQVFGGQRAWRQLLDEARRVLRRTGVLALGRTTMPDDGLDAQMKQRLGEILDKLGVQEKSRNFRADAESLLAGTASGIIQRNVAQWQAMRSPRIFLERHRTGARFSSLPEDVKESALGRLAAWAVTQFGSLDAGTAEQHRFELRLFKFQSAAGR